MLGLIDKGGPIMWGIVACSLLGSVIFWERLFHLHRAHIKTDDFLRGIFNLIQKKNIVEAISICEETPGPVAHIVRTAILHADEDREDVEQCVIDAGKEEIPRLERNLALLATIAKTAPLLGLLGTLLGMMQALMRMEKGAPLIHSGDLAGGLWQALISTAAGLTVAIPAYVAYNFLLSRVEQLVLDMERSVSEIMGFLKNRSHER